MTLRRHMYDENNIFKMTPSPILRLQDVTGWIGGAAGFSGGRPRDAACEGDTRLEQVWAFMRSTEMISCLSPPGWWRSFFAPLPTSLPGLAYGAAKGFCWLPLISGSVWLLLQEPMNKHSLEIHITVNKLQSVNLHFSSMFCIEPKVVHVGAEKIITLYFRRLYVISA